MIVGTAGHIDHGKTTLVRALTGIDTDRLPEEKKRGITIELGYASLTTPDGHTLSFVDVPGHEKLIRTMVAGASGIDCALILVAADDGVMPQTVEHTAILSLLGIDCGALVITKSDRVDASTLAQREGEGRGLLNDFGLGHFPVWAVSAVQGEGLPALSDWLAQQALRHQERGVAQRVAHHGFRMGLDRVFTLDGIGTVVAGSIQAGRVKVGDGLCLAHRPDHVFRVRSLHIHGRSVAQAQAGERCAVGLAGLDRQQVQRGMSLCAPELAQTRTRIDAWARVLPSEARALRSGTPVHVHVGTQELMATVAVLGQASLAPGEGGFVQLLTQTPVQVCWGDRLVLRDASAQRTLGGAQVLDPQGPARYRQTPERLEWLKALRIPEVTERLQAVLTHLPQGLLAPEWLSSQGLVSWPVEPDQLPEVHFEPQLGWLVAQRHLAHSQDMLIEMLKAFHLQSPQDMGPDVRRARNRVAPRMPEPMWEVLLSHLQAKGQIVRRNGFLCLPEQAEQLRQADLVVAQRVLPLLLAGRFDPPWVRDMVQTTRLSETQIRSVLIRLSKTAEVYQIVKDLFYHPEVVNELAQLARTVFEQEGEVTAANFRDATGLGRKRAIQILEFFDRAGLLRRVGDLHLVRPGATLFTSAGAP